MTSTGELNFRPGAGLVARGNTQEILFNSNGIVGTERDLTYNLQSNLLSVDGNVRVANSGNLLFGGGQANTAANSHFVVTYNASAQALDFVWQA